jgi:hypothetical protein
MSDLLSTADVETFTHKGYYKYEGINPNFNSTDAPDNYQQFKNVPLDTVYNGYDLEAYENQQFVSVFFQ